MLVIKLIEKIKKIIKDQDSKFIRKIFPSKPKSDPLPYKKKILQRVRRSLHELETPPVEKIIEPTKFYNGQVSFELKPKFSPLKLPTRQFVTEFKTKIC